MGRFESEEKRGGGSGEIGSATEELRTQIERQISEIVDAAQEKAAAIEEAALQKARSIEVESERRAHDIIENAVRRTESLMGSIESLESGVDEMVGSLRAETESLIADLRREAAGKKENLAVEQELLSQGQGEAAGAPAGEAPHPGLTGADPGQPSRIQPSQAPEAPGAAPMADVQGTASPQAAPSPPPPTGVADPLAGPAGNAQPPVAEPLQPRRADAATMQASEAPPATEMREAPPTAGMAESATAASPGAATPDIGSPEVREMIREQVTKMRRTGKSREDAARFLMRFKKGRSYLPIIDEVYGRDDGPEPEAEEEPRGVRGMLWRRRQRLMEEEDEAPGA